MKPQDFVTYAHEHKLSQSYMAKHIGIAQQTYVDYIYSRKKLKTPTLKKIETFYNNYIKKETTQKETTQEVSTSQFIDKMLSYKPKTEKVYLEAAEDVMIELTNGSEIYVENSGYSFKLINNFIVRYHNNLPISIGSPILCSERYYVIRPIPIKLEIGKKYLTRTGLKVTIFNKTDDEFYGVITGNSNVFSFEADGKCATSLTDEFDIVEEI